MRDLELAISNGHISRIVLKPFCMITLLDQLRLDMSVKEHLPAKTSDASI